MSRCLNLGVNDTMNPTLWTRNFILLTLANLFLFLSLEMMLPTLPVFAEQQGANETQVGLVLSFFAFAAVLSRPFAGAAAGTRMSRKLLLAIAVAICLIGTGSYFLATSILAIMLLRIVHGIGFGAATTLYGTAVSDVIPASRRGEGMGYFATGNAVAISLGPFIGIWLMESYSFTALFGVGAGVLLMAIIFTLFVSEKKPVTASSRAAQQAKTDKESEKGQSGPAASVRRLRLSDVVERKALFPSALGLLAGLSLSGIVSFISLFGKEAGVKNIGIFFLVLAVSEFLIRFISGPLFDRKGRSWVLIPSAFSCIIGVLLLSITDSTGMLLLAAVFYGMGFGAAFPALQAWVINLVESHRRGAATATFYNAFDIGIGSGAILLGYIASLTNYSTMYLASAVFYVIYLVIYIPYDRRQSKKTHAHSTE